MIKYYKTWRNENNFLGNSLYEVNEKAVLTEYTFMGDKYVKVNPTPLHLIDFNVKHGMKEITQNEFFVEMI